jgi:serine/threonine protein kinase
MDPEYVATQELTEKNDIYSYGVLVLELVTGRRAIQDDKNLIEWAEMYPSCGVISPEIVDPRIRGLVDMDQLHLVVGIVQNGAPRRKGGKGHPSDRF